MDNELQEGGYTIRPNDLKEGGYTIRPYEFSKGAWNFEILDNSSGEIKYDSQEDMECYEYEDTETCHKIGKEVIKSAALIGWTNVILVPVFRWRFCSRILKYLKVLWQIGTAHCLVALKKCVSLYK